MFCNPNFVSDDILLYVIPGSQRPSHIDLVRDEITSRLMRELKQVSNLLELLIIFYYYNY